MRLGRLSRKIRLTTQQPSLTMTQQAQMTPHLQALTRQRDELLARIAQQRGGQVSRADVAFAHFDHTQDDPGQVNTERDIEFAIGENETALLQQIDEALLRLQQGVYGFCPECGVSLSHERLTAAPHTTRCIACQTAFETAHAAH